MSCRSSFRIIPNIKRCSRDRKSPLPWAAAASRVSMRSRRRRRCAEGEGSRTLHRPMHGQPRRGYRRRASGGAGTPGHLGRDDGRAGALLDGSRDCSTAAERSACLLSTRSPLRKRMRSSSINRVKPHTAFRGKIESGLMKMIAIGLGKQKGAEACHQLVSSIWRRTCRPWPRDDGKLPIIFGVAIVENAYDQISASKSSGPRQMESGRRPCSSKRRRACRSSCSTDRCARRSITSARTSAATAWIRILRAVIRRLMPTAARK